MSTSEKIRVAREILQDSISYPGLPNRKAVSVLRIWLYPSFSAYVSWSVIKERNELFIRRIVWDQNATTVSAQPVTYGSEAPIALESFESIFSQLQRINISPFVPNNMAGIDGEIRGIEFGNFITSVSLSWWCKAPIEWAGLEVWFENAVELFEQTLPQRSVS